MFRRLSSFLLVLLAGAGIGWLASGLAGALAGVIAGAMVWFFTDLARGSRVILWLRDPQAREAPTLWGACCARATSS